MPVGAEVVVDDQAARGRDQFAVVGDSDLTLGEVLDLASDVVLTPGRHVGEAGPLHFDDTVEVRQLKRPDFQVALELGEIDLWHAGIFEP